jgi:hypothetical protein
MDRRNPDWVSKRVDIARNSAVSDAVAIVLKQQLLAKMSERVLRPQELSALARELIRTSMPPTDEATEA